MEYIVSNINFIIFSLAFIILVQPMYSQLPIRDTTFHPYHVNYRVTGTILGLGSLANFLGIGEVLHKEEVSRLEIQALNRGNINNFDHWALKQDPSKISVFQTYSDFTLVSSVVLLIVLRNLEEDPGKVFDPPLVP